MDAYEPINTLKEFCSDVWVVDSDVFYLHDIPGVPLTIPNITRAAIFRLQSGEVMIVSPTEITDELKAQVAALGPIRHIVAPNLEHFKFIHGWKAAFPDATVWGAPGVREELVAMPGGYDCVDCDLEDSDKNWPSEIGLASKTVYIADGFINYEPKRIRGRLMRMVFRFGNVAGGDSKVSTQGTAGFMQRMVRKRKLLPAMKASVSNLLDLEPENILVGHGANVAGDGKEALKRVFAWAK